MKVQRMLAMFVLCCALGLVGCDSPANCGSGLVARAPSLEVTVRDSVTGALVANATVTMIPEVSRDSVSRTVGADVSEYPVWIAAWGGTSVVSAAAPDHMPFSETLTLPRDCSQLRTSLTFLLHKIFLSPAGETR
jgi:hypothetical protein